jgi:hypothetical protein
VREKLEVVLFLGDESAYQTYAAAFSHSRLHIFRVFHRELDEVFAEPGFDALYWPLAGAERWNVLPVEDVIQLVETDDEYQKRGWPRYLLVGLVLSPTNARGVEVGFATWARALLAAVDLHTEDTVSRVKVMSDMVRLAEVEPTRAAAILARVEREYASTEPSRTERGDGRNGV